MKRNDILDSVIIIAAGFLTYGLQILWLGFFQDDWNFVFFSVARGAQGIFEFLIQDGRPGASWVYVLGFGLLGYEPALWQIFTIALRILTTIVFWLILKKYWPHRRYENLTASILFLTYPFFTLQPLSVAYAPHFFAFLLYMTSLYLMIQAAERPERYFRCSALAILLTFIHLFTVEYFIGLELFRPILLWFALHPAGQLATARRLKKTAVHWAPYLISLLAFVVWRIIFISNLGIRINPVDTIFGPDSVVLSLARNVVADLALMLVSTWSKLITPDLLVIGPVRNLYVFVISLFAGLTYFFFLRPINRVGSTPVNLKTILFMGGLAIALGLVPAYAAGYIIHPRIPPWNSRFALPALPGLALVVLTVIEALITMPRIRHIFLSVLIGLLIGSHNYNTFVFKTAWEKQERFYQQLVWRAPSIEPGTAIIANEEIMGYMGDYPLSFAINAIYGAKPERNIPYWFFAISENFDFSIDQVFAHDRLQDERAFMAFDGDTSDAVFITYEPEIGQCLWVLRSQNAEYKHLPQNMKIAASRSNIMSLQDKAGDMTVYSQIVDENRPAWCYYYQKAELARQVNDWETIVMLWDEARSNDLRPYNGFEFLPFIEAYAHLGRWDDAYRLTDRANRITPAMYLMLCPAWEQLNKDTPDGSGKEGSVKDAYDALNCIEP